MPRYFRLTSTVAVASLAVLPMALSAQVASRVTVNYADAPLSRVVASFAQFSNRAIFLAPDVGDQYITGNVQNADWRIGLDQLLQSQNLVLRPDSSSVIRVHHDQPITVEFENAPLSQVLRGIATFSKRSIRMAPGVGDPTITFTALGMDWQRALDRVARDNGLTASADANGDFLITR